MKLTLSPTETIQRIDGVQCRLWTGEDEAGTAIHAYIAAVSPQTHDEERLEAFDQALQELPPARIDGVMVSWRFVS